MESWKIVKVFGAYGGGSEIEKYTEKDDKSGNRGGRRESRIGSEEKGEGG